MNDPKETTEDMKQGGAESPLPEATGYALPELWMEIEPEKVWARAKTCDNGELMGLKCELKLVLGKYRWMTLHPQKFGVGDTLGEAIEQVEEFLHNLKDHARNEGAERRNGVE